MQKIKQFAKDYKGIILFFMALFGANIIWKLCITGNEDIGTIMVFNIFDISAAMHKASVHIAQITCFFTRLFDSSTYLTRENIICHTNNQAVKIVWSCTGIKQMFIFLCVMIFASGSWKNKLWYIPVGLVLCYIINIIRTTVLALIVKNHYELFPLMHHHLLKYLYYGLIFLIWVAWEEKFKYFILQKRQ